MQQCLDDRHLSPQTKVLFCMQKYLFCAQEVEMDVFTLHFFFFSTVCLSSKSKQSVHMYIIILIGCRQLRNLFSKQMAFLAFFT